VEEERDRGWVYYGLRRGDGPPGLLRELLRRRLRGLEAKGDDARLQEVLRHREEDFTRERGLVPGKSWAAWARALGHLLPPLRVADLGCGEGHLAIEASRWAGRVTAVDVSAAALEAARARARERGAREIVWKRGDIEDLPLETGSFDVALLSQALHHAREPRRAVQEGVRILAPGGTLLVLDLKTHGEEWVRKLGDHWLGFDEAAIRRMMTEAGLVRVRIEVGSRKRGDPFQVLVASGRKPPPKGS
jgi:ArsR family transcriptional regulator